MEKRVLIARWFGPDTQPIPIYDEASVSSARQRVREAGRNANLDTDIIEKTVLMASELTHNQLAHSKQGYFAVKPVDRLGVKGLEIVAGDIGPGIKKPVRAIQSENSTSGSLGAGLGSVTRLADELEFDDRVEEGFCVIARKFDRHAKPLCAEIGIMGWPYPGEAISGDDGVVIQSETGFLAAVADGLGHGPEARLASNRAIEALIRNRDLEIRRLAVAINADLLGTRGCAMTIVRFDRNSQMIECASTGDVHAHLYTLKDAHFFTSTPLILGEAALLEQKVRIETNAAEPGSVLVMFTDGLKSRTSIKGQLDVLRQPPIAIAQHLLDHDSRPDDDALVLVARFARHNV